MGTHPIFESDFDCLTDNGSTSDLEMRENAFSSNSIQLAEVSIRLEIGPSR